MIVRALPFLLLLLLGALPAAALQEDAAEDAPFGTFLTEVQGLSVPAAADVDAHGNVFVVEAGAHRVRAFTPDGRELLRFGALGSGEGELCAPRGIALAPDSDEVYVTDTGNHRVHAFRRDGSHVRTFGARGSGLGELCEPRGLWVGERLVLVADAGNDRVSVFDREGVPLTTVGSRGTGAGELRRPIDVAYDPEFAELYVADDDNSRILRFTLEEKEGLFTGQHLGQWGDWGGYDGQLDGPSGIDVSGELLYVSDRGNHRIQVFDLAGGWQTDFGEHAIRPRESGGKIHYPGDVALAADGSFVVVCETFENRLQIFRRRRPGDPEPLPPIGTPKGTGANHFGSFAAGAADLLVTLAPESHSLVVHDTTAETPVRITVLGGYGGRNGAFIRPGGVALDGSRMRVLASDTGGRRVQEFVLAHSTEDPLRFDPQLGRFARGLDLELLGRSVLGHELEWTIEPGPLVHTSAGEVLLLDTRNERVWVLDERLLPARTFGGHGTEPGRFRRPTDLCVGPTGEVYVVDAHNFRVQVFDARGRWLRDIGRRGEGLGEFLGPFGVAVAPDGRVFVTDELRHCVQVFDAEGRARFQFGREGLLRTEFYKPRGMTFDEHGNLCVIDYGNHRVQRFDLDGNYVDVFGARWFALPARRQGQEGGR